MDPALLKLIEYSPAVVVLAFIVWFFLRQQEKREAGMMKRDEVVLANFISTNERLSQANHKLVELMDNHLAELLLSMGQHIQSSISAHQELREILLGMRHDEARKP